MVWDNRPLFEEDFCAWKQGPISPLLNLAFDVDAQIATAAMLDEGNSLHLSEEQKDSIDVILHDWRTRTAAYMASPITEETPYKEARKQVRKWEPYGPVISKESIREYYVETYGVRAHDVAYYILTEKGRMSLWDLEWYLYLVQAKCLATYGSTLFDGTFRAMPKGPVCQEFGSVYDYPTSLVSYNLPRGDIRRLADDHLDIIDFVFDRYPTGIPEPAPNEPWRQALETKGDYMISHEAMKNYYRRFFSEAPAKTPDISPNEPKKEAIP